MDDNALKTQVMEITKVDIEIVDDASYSFAGEQVKLANSKVKEVKAWFKPYKDEAFRKHKEITTREKEILSVVSDFLTTTKQRMVEYDTEQQRKALEQQRRLEEEARKREEERKLAEAEQAEAEGDSTLAEEIINEEIDIPVVAVPQGTPKVSGVSYRDNWKACVKDKMEFIRFVAEHPEWENLLVPNQKSLDQLAKAQKESMQIPGVASINNRTIVTRT